MRELLIPYVRPFGVYLVASLCAVISQPANAQTVTPNNYRAYARCVEVEVNGKIYSTFGESHCPPGSMSRGYDPKPTTDINSLNMQRTQAAVNALSQAQQSVLALGQAIAARQQARSQELANNTFIEITATELVGNPALYSPIVSIVPFPNSINIMRSGSVVAQSMHGFYSECIIPQVEHSGSQIGGWKFKVLPGQPACKLKASDSGYMPTYFNSGQGKDIYNFIYALSLKGEGTGRSLCFRNMGVNFSCKKDITDSDVVAVKGFVGDLGTLSDTLILSSLDGDSADFTYAAGSVQDGRSIPSQYHVVMTKGGQAEVGPYTVHFVDWSPTALVAKLERTR